MKLAVFTVIVLSLTCIALARADEDTSVTPVTENNEIYIEPSHTPPGPAKRDTTLSPNPLDPNDCKRGIDEANQEACQP